MENCLCMFYVQRNIFLTLLFLSPYSRVWRLSSIIHMENCCCTVKHGSRKAQRHQFHIHMAWRVVNQSMGEININGGKLSLHNRIHFHYAMLWVESVWFEWKELCGCRSSASIAVAILQINKQQKQGNDIFTMD